MTSTANLGATTQGAWETAARAGYVVSGALHILIGVIALRLALGDSSQSADQSGALSTVADEPLGRVGLWVAAVALLALAGWQIAKAVHLGSAAARGASSSGDRAKAIGRGVVYLGLAVVTATWARGTGSSSSDDTQDLTADLMDAPAGRILVGALGLAIVAVGVYHVVKGWRQKFLEDLQGLPAGEAGRGSRVAGTVGYIAKGVALGIVGGLFVAAAWHADESEATGLDGAMRTLKEGPAGPLLLALVALGFVAYGVYSLVRARYGRL